MKKYIYPIAFVGTVVVLSGLVVVGYRSQKDAKSSDVAVSCEKLPVSELDSERSQGVLIKDRKILVVRLNNETNYSVPGGHIDFGEDAKTALHRELKEEVGIESDTDSYQYFKTDCQPKNEKQQRIYYYKVGSWKDKISLESQGDKVKWVDSSYLEKKKSDTDVKLVLYYLQQEGLID